MKQGIYFMFRGGIVEIPLGRPGAGCHGGMRILRSGGPAAEHQTRHNCESNQRGEHVIKNSDGAVGRRVNRPL